MMAAKTPPMLAPIAAAPEDGLADAVEEVVPVAAFDADVATRRVEVTAAEPELIAEVAAAVEFK